MDEPLDKLFIFNKYVCDCDIETYNLTVALFEKLQLDDTYIPAIWWIAHKYLDDGASYFVDVICEEWGVDAETIIEKELEVLTLLDWNIESLVATPPRATLNNSELQEWMDCKLPIVPLSPITGQISRRI